MIITSREFKKLLRKNGYVYVRSKGSHDIYKNDKNTVAVPVRLNRMIAQRLIKELNLSL